MAGYIKLLLQYNILITSCIFQVSISPASHQMILTQNELVTDCCQFIPCPLTSRSRNGSVYVMTIHKPFRATHKVLSKFINKQWQNVFMGMTLKQITGLHKRIIAYNEGQTNTFNMSFLTHAFVTLDSVPHVQGIFLQYSVACVAKTFSEMVQWRCFVYQDNVPAHCALSLQEFVHRNHITFVSTLHLVSFIFKTNQYWRGQI